MLQFQVRETSFKVKNTHSGSDLTLPKPAFLSDFVWASKLLHVFAEVTLSTVLCSSTRLTLPTHSDRPFHLGALKQQFQLTALILKYSNNSLKQISILLLIHVAFHSCIPECLECCTVFHICPVPLPFLLFSLIYTLFPGRGIHLMAERIKLQCLICKDVFCIIINRTF